MILPVTSVTADKASHEITVVCGGEYRITEADFLSLGIAETGEADTDRLSFCDSKLRCIKKSESYLSYGDHSEKKMREKLKGKFEEDVIDEVMKLLVKRGYIDDASLAERYASELARTRLWGRKRIAQYLFTKGFCRSDIENACGSVDDETYHENLLALIEKSVSKYDLSDRTSVSKFMNTLYRNGYGWDEIKSALSDYVEE